jgi:CBS domain-containing protein
LPAIFKDALVRNLFPFVKSVVSLRNTDTVSDCIWRLTKEQIISAPVFNEQGKIVGIVDVLDFCLFAIGLFPKEVNLESLTEEQVEQVVAVGQKFQTSPVEDVLQLSYALKEHQHVFYVTRDTSLPRLLELFYGGVHRVAVTSSSDEETAEKGLLLNVISQSDLLDIFAQSLPLLDKTARNKTVKDLQLGSRDIVTASHKKRAIDVLYKMNKWISKPIISAVPIVDDNGALVATFSASNLKGITPSSFANLLLPVVQYLKWQPETTFLGSLQNAKSLNPITVTEWSTFEEVVFKLAATRVHRLWVVDDDNKPIGVISLGDVFRVFLPY